MDLGLEYCRKLNADLLLATDPDCDRCGIAVKDGNDYKVDTNGTKEAMSDFVKNHGDEILKYLNSEGSITLKNKSDKTAGNYLLTGVFNSKQWYVCYNIGTDARVKDKLAARAKSVGLFGSALGVDGNKALDEFTNQDVVCMLVLKIED